MQTHIYHVKPVETITSIKGFCVLKETFERKDHRDNQDDDLHKITIGISTIPTKDKSRSLKRWKSANTKDYGS